MLRSLSRLVLVLIAAAVIAVCAGGFSWDGTPDNFGWSTPDTATVDGFSWDDGFASSTAAAAG